ncbi:MAG: TerB family tellurite resistance protein [Alphaproteobacteria bacterium]|nr:TerB family tellurite resistance protein [Alphaproteobacteria bacterium]
MVNRIFSLFTRQPDKGAVENAKFSLEEKHIATVALLIEAAMQDGELGAEEKSAIESLAGRHFSLPAAHVAQLFDLARTRQESANQIFGFTHRINQSFAPEERIEVVEMLWEVVYSDGVLHDYEANLMRRIGGLIYVSDIDRGHARKRVMTRLGIE